MDFNYEESTQRILQIDSEIANLGSEKTTISKSICERIYPQYKEGVKVKFFHEDLDKQGIIEFVRLDKNNPFKIRINIRPLNKNFERFNRVVVNTVTVNMEDIREIVS